MRHVPGFDEVGLRRKLFAKCPGDPSFHRNQPVVRRKATDAERAHKPLWNGTQYRDLGSINHFAEVVPGVWVAEVLWENLRRSQVRLRDLEDSHEWMVRTGYPSYIEGELTHAGETRMARGLPEPEWTQTPH